jgi:hypothetical protein
MPGYCWTCGWPADKLAGALDPATRMCAWCTRDWAGRWRRAHPPPRDLGSR